MICRAGCRQDDVIGALRGRGLWPAPASEPSRRTRRREPSVTGLALELAARQPWARDPELYRAYDDTRASRQRVDQLRRAATAAGPSDAAWDVLAFAAWLEREGLAVEAELDALMAEGQIA